MGVTLNSLYQKTDEFFGNLLLAEFGHWPHGSRCRLAAAPPSEIVGLDPTRVMDVCLL